jgi:hypothetical protein
VNAEQTGLPAVVLILAASAVLGAIGVAAWRSWRRRPLRRLVLTGHAEWAASGSIRVGARHLDHGTERPSSRPAGVFTVRDQRLRWVPAPSAVRRGHQAAEHPLTSLRLLQRWTRHWPTGQSYEEVHLGVGNEVVVVYIYTQVGRRFP